MASVTSEYAVTMPLTVENIISRIHLPANVPDVVPSIVMDFLVPDISLARAIDVSSSVALLDFIWARSVRDARSDRWSVARLLQSQPRYFRWEFSQALLQAVSCEDRGMVEWVVAHFPGCPVSGRVLEEVAARGWLWLLQLLQAQEGGALRCSKETLSKAAENGHWEVVHWLIDHTNTVQDNHRYLVGIAVGANNLEEYRWLKARGYGVDRVAFTESPQEEWPVRKEIFYDVLQRSRWMAGSALRDAARNDDVPFAEWLVTHYCKDGGTNLPHYSGAKAASEKGCLEMLQWHLKRLRDVIDLSEVMFLAAENGRLEVVKWLRTEYATKPSVDLFQGTSSHFGASACAFAMDAAAGQGHLDVLQFLHELCISLQTQRKAEHPGSFQHDAHIPHFGPQCSRWAMDLAAFAGHLDVVQWLHFNRTEGCTTAAMDKGAVNGHLDGVKWLRLHRSEGCSSWALDMVASKQHPDKDSEMAAKAFYGKQLEILEWMHRDNAQTCTTAAMDGAAANGNLEMLEWLRANTTAGCLHKAMDMAAKNGHLDSVKWLHEHENSRTKCTAAALDDAAANGHLEVVKWLSGNRPEGCTRAAMDKAASNGHLGVVKWLQSARPEGCTQQALDGAAGNGHLDVLTFLQANRLERWTSVAVHEAAKCGHLEIVKWLFASRSEDSALANAGITRHLRLEPRCRKKQIISAMRQAVEHDHFEVVLFLHTMYVKCRDANKMQAELKRNLFWVRNDDEIRAWIEEH